MEHEERCLLLFLSWKQADEIAAAEPGKCAIERCQPTAIPACEAKQISISNLFGGGG
jgi:hypothetical protein